MRALGEDTRGFTSLLLHWARQLFLGIPSFISDPVNLCLLLDLCESFGSCINYFLQVESRYLGLPDVIEAKYNVSEEVTVCFFPDPGDQLINMVLYLDGIERRQQDLREKSLDKLSFNIAFLTNSTIYFEATVSHNAQPLRSHNITVIGKFVSNEDNQCPFCVCDMHMY